MGKDIITNNQEINNLFQKVVDLITQARKRVATTVNIAEVYTKFHIGQYIVEYEQKGEIRAEYGKTVLKEPSKRLTDRLGDGWGYSTLKNIKQFYLVYAKRLNTVEPIENSKLRLQNEERKYDQDLVQDKKDKHCLAFSEESFTLSWSHYSNIDAYNRPNGSKIL